MLIGDDFVFHFESNISFALWILTFLVLFATPIISIFQTRIRPSIT